MRHIAKVRERQPCVYILASGFNGTLYVGVTSDLPARIFQHRNGIHDGFTQRHDVKRLVWYEATDQMTDAIASEKRIKKWPRDWKKNLIERGNPEWSDLALGFGFEPLCERPSRPRNKSGVKDTISKL